MSRYCENKMFDFYQWKDGHNDYYKARDRRKRQSGMSSDMVCPDFTELTSIFLSF